MNQRHHNADVEMKQGQITLRSANALPLATGFLYNSSMMIQMNCRGFARATHMQPEPAKYSFGPQLEAKTFFQPEQGYFSHHPGRFFYIRDNHTGELFSVPFEPCRKNADSFEFKLTHHQISWDIRYGDLAIEVILTLDDKDAIECWKISLTNHGDTRRDLSVFPYFSIGYQSWMYREANYDPSLQAIIAKSISPYQRLEEQPQVAQYKDSTFLLSEQQPDAWLCNQQIFEGNGQLSEPEALKGSLLNKAPARYEDPAAIMQFELKLLPQHSSDYRFAFGPAKSPSDILAIKKRLWLDPKVAQDTESNQPYQQLDDTQNHACDKYALAQLAFDSNGVFCEFVNYWLPNQVNCLGRLHRLTTDPQTRNYLQDAIGMCFIAPEHSKQVLIRALSQQSCSGEMPDGVLLNSGAQLKYINQIPHADANIWLPILLLAYLNETNDIDCLLTSVGFADSEEQAPLYRHIELAIDYVLTQRDHRGLCLIHQGDWCDPMNMVGHLGQGVSTWLTLALAYAIGCWIEVINHYGNGVTALTQSVTQSVPQLETLKLSLNEAVNKYCWHGDWYARGITDHGRLFGVATEHEGAIYLNPQSWALLSGAATETKKNSILSEVERHLNTPFGVMMLAPSYTSFIDDIGRITQKYPGVAENGSVYNHAAVFYAYSLYQIGEYNLAFQVLTRLLPDESDMLIKGQLPNFIPNYYRGAYYQLPDMAGRSSQLIHTGTAAWMYRCVIEELCGLKGRQGRLQVQPKLPDCIDKLAGKRLFAGGTFEFSIEKSTIEQMTIWLDGVLVSGNAIGNIVPNQHYQLLIQMPQ
ncbi:GH36-type glycosyl hydrolase domain-containing protein [Colwellia sp. MEBiC06753]